MAPRTRDENMSANDNTPPDNMNRNLTNPIPENRNTTKPTIHPDSDNSATAANKPPRASLTSSEQSANVFNRVLFLWAQPLFTRAAALQKEGKALEMTDLIPLPEMDYSERLSQRFESEWAKRHDREDNSEALHLHLRQALVHVVGPRIYLAGLLKLFNTCLQFTFPLVLNNLLMFIESMAMFGGDGSTYNRFDGYWMAGVLFVAMSGKAITENLYFHMVYRCGFQIRVAVSTSVYKKSLRMASSARRGTTLGELVNLMQVDATKIEMFIPQFHTLWDGVVQIAGYMTILYTLIGWSCFIGLAVMIVAGPVQGVIMKRLFGLNRKMVTHTDARTKTTNEAVQGIACVKMYTWEDSFQEGIAARRDGELAILKNVAYLRAFSRAYMGALPGIVAVVSFVTFASGAGGSIKASTLFAALVAFDQLRFPLLFYPMSLAQLAQAKVSLYRVAAFMGMAETGEGMKGEYRKGEGGDGEIVMEDVTAYWSDPTVPLAKMQEGSALNISSKKDKPKKGKKNEETKKGNGDDETVDKEETGSNDYAQPILSKVSLTINPGQLCAIVGRVGCGKSSLCATLLNETIISEGSVKLSGSVAYATQSAWILNKSIRHNILFGEVYEKDRYDAVIEACQLRHDLNILTDGDMTEIGERGINLSGGQKQRISIARAAYSRADIVILDDPLSALDPAVAQRMFENCLLGLMKNRTRLLVTNQIQNLKFCDRVISMRDGRIVEQGTYEELLAIEDGEVNRLMVELDSAGSERRRSSVMREDNDGTKMERDEKKSDVSAPILLKKETTEAKALLTKEERAIGAVKWSVYKKYLKAGGGYALFAFVYFFFVVTAVTNLLVNVVIAAWTSDASYERFSMPFYMGIYAAAAVAMGIVTFIRSYFLARFGVRASQFLHENLVSSILHAPTSFFDTTPTGRIISRFSKDMYSIDHELADYLDFFLFCSLYVVVTLATIMFATPWFAVAVLPLSMVYVFVLNYFRAVSRETKRLESVSRSPVYATFSETLGGLDTIRAYGCGPRFVTDFLGKLDENTQAYYCNKSADRWLSVRIELIGSLIAGIAATLAAHVAISDSAGSTGEKNEFASVAGLSLTYAVSVTGLLNWAIRSFAQTEAAMNACERVLYYSEDIPREAAFTGKQLEDDCNEKKQALTTAESGRSSPAVFAVTTSGGKALYPDKDWPARGSIILQNLRMRYRSDTPLVLKGLNVRIAGGERIGIVGRTGSGKSSLLLCLLRMVEPDLEEIDNPPSSTKKYEPPMSIDGVDTLRIGLRDLRSQLGIIPQNPVLFSGTVRSNLDPFSEYTDDDLWTALSACGMKITVEAMPSKLDATVAEYGENLSQGQRQLLCLGRALLKKCRILLLDEATSSVDFETDREIQRTLRTAFPDCTVLTIAHRVDTIMDSDKILVMKDGVAEEFASPKELLENEESLFSEIVRHADAETLS